MRRHMPHSFSVPVLCQRSLEEWSGSGRDVRDPKAMESRPLNIPQFITDKALVEPTAVPGSISISGIP